MCAQSQLHPIHQQLVRLAVHIVILDIKGCICRFLGWHIIPYTPFHLQGDDTIYLYFRELRRPRSS